MSDIDSLFVAIFNLSGVKRQSALLERAESLVGNLFYVIKNRRLMGSDNVSYREHLEALHKILEELVTTHGVVDLWVRHQALYINGCLIPQLVLGRDEPQTYLVTSFGKREIEQLRFDVPPDPQALDTVLETLTALPEGWPEEGRITGSGIRIARARPGESSDAPTEAEARARWVYLNLLEARRTMDLKDENDIRDALRFSRWHLHELVELCEHHPRTMLSLSHLRWQPRFRGKPAVADVNTAILACLMSQRLSLKRGPVLRLTHGGFLYRWLPADEAVATSPAVRTAAALLKGGGVNPFNFSLMVLLNERFEETRNRSAEIVRVAARFEELLEDAECTVATALTTLLSDSELYYDRTSRLLLDVWRAFGGPETRVVA